VPPIVDKCGKGYVSNRTVYTVGCLKVFNEYLSARIQVISILGIGLAAIILLMVIFLIYSGITTKGEYHIIST
jgi:hypothetical protein